MKIKYIEYKGRMTFPFAIENYRLTPDNFIRGKATYDIATGDELRQLEFSTCMVTLTRRYGSGSNNIYHVDIDGHHWRGYRYYERIMDIVRKGMKDGKHSQEL